MSSVGNLRLRPKRLGGLGAGAGGEFTGLLPSELAVADNAAMAAVPEADRVDRQLRLNEADGRAWYFDAQSAAAGDANIIAPDVGTGRWIATRSALNLKQKEETQIAVEAASDTIRLRWRAADIQTLIGLSVMSIGALSTSAAGIYILTVVKGDPPGNVNPAGGKNQLAGASINCEVGGDLIASDDKLFEGGDLTATAADLVYAVGDWLIADVISDNADLTGGSGLWVTPIWSL